MYNFKKGFCRCFGIKEWPPPACAMHSFCTFSSVIKNFCMLLSSIHVLDLTPPSIHSCLLLRATAPFQTLNQQIPRPPGFNPGATKTMHTQSLGLRALFWVLQNEEEASHPIVTIGGWVQTCINVATKSDLCLTLNGSSGNFYDLQ